MSLAGSPEAQRRELRNELKEQKRDAERRESPEQCRSKLLGFTV